MVYALTAPTVVKHRRRMAAKHAEVPKPSLVHKLPGPVQRRRHAYEVQRIAAAARQPE